MVLKLSKWNILLYKCIFIYSTVFITILNIIYDCIFYVENKKNVISLRLEMVWKINFIFYFQHVPMNIII